MSAIGSISSVVSVARDEAVQQQRTAAPQPVQETQEAQAAASSGAGGQSDSAAMGFAGLQRNSESESDSNSETVASLQKQVEQLQKQLKQAQEELRSVQTSTMDEKQKAAMEGALQVQVAMLNSSLMSMMMKLSEAIANENGQKFAQGGGASAAQG